MIVDFEPVGIRTRVRQGESLLAAARESGIMLQALCGGGGTCGRCRIRVMDGDVPPAGLKEGGYFSQQRLDEGWRLACRVVPQGGMTVYIPPKSLTA